MNEILKKLSLIGIVPVVKLENAEDALPLAAALERGGLPCAEITFRTARASSAIRLISENCPNMLVGAGTVLTTEQADEAIAAGAKFIVCPGLNPKVVRHCLELGVTVIPGCATAGEIEQALELGLETVKFFPAEALGGVTMLKALAPVYSGISFMPTGGIGPDNLNKYLAFPRVLACGGSWMVKEELICGGRFDEITLQTRQAVAGMLGFSLAHIGLNSAQPEDAERTASALSGLFGFETEERPKSFFAGNSIEIMKNPGFGRNGHLGIGTNSIERAVAHLSGIGCKFNNEAAYYDDNGKLFSIYLADAIGGFKVHLLQK